MNFPGRRTTRRSNSNFSGVLCASLALTAIVLVTACGKEQNRTVDLTLFPESAAAVQSVNDKRGRILVAEPGTSIAIYEHLPKNAHLKCEYGIHGEAPEGAAARFEIRMEIAGRAPVSLFSETVSGGFISAPAGAQSIDLSPFAEQIVRFVLTTGAMDRGPSPAQIFWGPILLTTPESRTKEQPGSGGPMGDRQDGAAPNVVLYIIDALRPDHLEPYGYRKPTSPRISEFASDAVVFEYAYAQSAWTRASVATILTGLYPSSHLAEDRPDALPEFLPSLPKALKSAGYFTYGFISQPNVGPKSGFEKHFDAYYDLFRQKKGAPLQSDQLFESTRKLILQGIQHPAFLYVHAVDTHEPYSPTADFLHMPEDCDPQDPEVFHPVKYAPQNPSDHQRNCVISIYDSAVLQSDHYFGEFLDLLKENRMYDNSIIILTADHGESFAEHGEWGHGSSLYQTQIRIPLIVRFPGNRFAGKRIGIPARHLDLFPSVLDAIGLEPPPGVQGTSLLPSLHGHDIPVPPVFSELSLGRSRAKALILGQYKLIEHTIPRSVQYRMYNLMDDPHERVDLYRQKPIRAGYLKKRLHEWSAYQAIRKASLEKPDEVRMDDETEELLRALGYVQ